MSNPAAEATAATSASPRGEGQQITAKTRSKYKIEDSVINHELRRGLWDGMLPLRVTLSDDDNFSHKEPSALYVSFSSYLIVSGR